MKANTKKLFSLLVVVALVLSMAPAITLQAEAAFDATNTVCDACGVAPEGGWTEIPESTTGVTLDTSGHYYLSGGLNGTTNPMLKVNAGVTACLHSNGQRIRNSRAASNTTRTVAINVAGTLNYMGDGTVVNRSATTTYPSVVIASGGSLKLYGGTFYNFDPSAYVASGYAVSGSSTDAEGNGTWTVAEVVGPDLPSTCPGCGDTVTEWTAVTAATGTSDWAKGSGHFYLANDLTGSAKRVMQFPADIEVCLHLNGHDITSTCATSGSITVRSYATLRIMGEGTISAGDNTAAMGAVVAYGGTVEIYGGTYVDNTENDPVRVNGGEIVVYGGTFCDSVSGMVADGYEETENEDGTFTVAEVVTPTITADCPHCDEENITWVPFTGGNTADTTTHYYLAEKLENTNAAVLQTYGDAILYLNGQDMEFNGRIRARSGFNIYIFGEGNVTRKDSSETYTMFDSSSTGYTYIYGGNFTNNDPDVAMFTGEKFVITGGTFNEDPSAYVDTETYVVTESNGIYTVSVKPEGPVLPTTCPGCNATVTEWTELTSAGFGSGVTEHTHFYVAEDTTITGTANSLQTYADQCIYLAEGATLTNYGRLRLRGGFNVYVFGDGNYVHADGESTYGMFQSASSGYLYISGGNWTDNETNGVAPFDGTRYVITGGTFNFDPSAYVADGYKATETDGIWTVTEYVAPTLPTTCPMCNAENVTWTEVTAATGDTGFAATGHYALANNISGGSKRVFRVLEGTEICLHLNGYNITGTAATNGTQAFQVYGTLRITGEGTVSTPNVAVPEGDTADWSTVAAAAAGAVVEIYGGTYVDSTARNRTVRAADGATLTVYDGSFSDEVTGFVAEGKWCLPKADMWYVEDMTAAAIITETGYTTYETTEAAVAAYTEGYILMGSADSIELTKNAVVDSNDKENIVVTGEGVLSPVGGGSWDLTNANVSRDATNPVTGQRYLTVENNTYKFTMDISKVVLRPGTTSDTLGIYYKTNINVGDDLVGLIDSYGVALSLVEMPTAEDILAVDTHALYTVVDNDLVAGENEVNSGLLNNILKTSYTAEELTSLNAADTAAANTARGELKIYANAYIAIDLDGDGNEEYVMADVEYNNIEHSLKSIMGKVDALATIPQAAINCYKAWASYGMDTWGLTNLAAKAEEA